MFQSTPPRGRRLKGRFPKSPARSFNPRLRAGGDPLQGVITDIIIEVSIHASEREATSDVGNSCFWIGVSIHASAREATSAKI